MPEGPSIVILKELVEAFKGKPVIEIGGNTKVDFSSLQSKDHPLQKFWKKFFHLF
jgi:endonuclease-8